MKFFLPEREQGQGLVEYALILALVAVVVLGILYLLGPQINLAYAKVLAGLNGAGSYDYTISSFSVTTSSPVPGSCRYEVSGAIAAQENGANVANGTKVVGFMSNPSIVINSTTSGGTASFNVSETVSGACPSGTATLIFGSATATSSY